MKIASCKSSGPCVKKKMLKMILCLPQRNITFYFRLATCIPCICIHISFNVYRYEQHLMPIPSHLSFSKIESFIWYETTPPLVFTSFIDHLMRDKVLSKCISAAAKYKPEMNAIIEHPIRRYPIMFNSVWRYMSKIGLLRIFLLYFNFFDYFASSNPTRIELSAFFSLA